MSPYAAVLSKLEHEKKQIDEGIALIRRLMDRDKGDAPKIRHARRKRARGGKRKAGSTADQIIRLLEASREKAFNAGEIGEALNKPTKAIRTTLQRIEKTGKIAKAAIGRYQAKAAHAAA